MKFRVTSVHEERMRRAACAEVEAAESARLERLMRLQCSSEDATAAQKAFPGSTVRWITGEWGGWTMVIPLDLAAIKARAKVAGLMFAFSENEKMIVDRLAGLGLKLALAEMRDGAWRGALVQLGWRDGSKR